MRYSLTLASNFLRSDTYTSAISVSKGSSGFGSASKLTYDLKNIYLPFVKRVDHQSAKDRFPLRGWFPCLGI